MLNYTDLGGAEEGRYPEEVKGDFLERMLRLWEIHKKLKAEKRKEYKGLEGDEK